MRIEPSSAQGLDLARVLVVHGELAPRLTLQTLLQAGGYSVDVAGSPAEAVSKLDTNTYQLVLTDAAPGNQNLLAYARVKEYRPATATITSPDPAPRRPRRGAPHKYSIRMQDVPHLLGKVADLIGVRAIRRYRAV
jgi:PleD family two-component response regulator